MKNAGYSKGTLNVVQCFLELNLLTIMENIRNLIRSFLIRPEFHYTILPPDTAPKFNVSVTNFF